jgi:hypothetical protein
MAVRTKRGRHTNLGAVVGGLCIALPAGCAVESPTEEPAARTSKATQALALDVCQPLTCCFPAGGGWSRNPFEDALKALGCTVPQAYT